MSRVKQGGDKGEALTILCDPSAGFKTTIDGYADKGDAIGKLVTLADNYVVSLAADNAMPNGIIRGIQGNKTNGYSLTVELLALNCQNANVAYFKPTKIVNQPYSGTIAFGNAVQMNGADGVSVDAGSATTGYGFVLAKDNPSTGRVDVAY